MLIIHDTGAHGHAMGFNYNGILRPKELLLKEDGGIELIRREETVDDYFATLNFEPNRLEPSIPTKINDSEPFDLNRVDTESKHWPEQIF